MAVKFKQHFFFNIIVPKFWNEHEKWIQIGTNKPKFGIVVLEIGRYINTNNIINSIEDYLA